MSLPTLLQNVSASNRRRIVKGTYKQRKQNLCDRRAPRLVRPRAGAATLSLTAVDQLVQQQSQRPPLGGGQVCASGFLVFRDALAKHAQHPLASR